MKHDPITEALAELNRWDRECRETHARFQAAIAGPREAFERAMADALSHKEPAHD